MHFAINEYVLFLRNTRTLKSTNITYFTEGVLYETGTAYPSHAHEFTLDIFGGVRVVRLFSFHCCVLLLFVVVLCFVPNVACVSGLYTLSCSFGFL